MRQVREAHGDGDSTVVDAKRKLAGSRNDKHSEKVEKTGLLEGLCAEKARRLSSLVTASGAYRKVPSLGWFLGVGKQERPRRTLQRRDKWLGTVTNPNIVGLATTRPFPGGYRLTGLLAREATVSLWNISLTARLR